MVEDQTDVAISQVSTAAQVTAIGADLTGEPQVAAPVAAATVQADQGVQAALNDAAQAEAVEEVEQQPAPPSHI